MNPLLRLSDTLFDRYRLSTPGIMRTVMLALLPGTLLSLYLQDGDLLRRLGLLGGTALLSEALVLWLRQRPLLPSLLDGSALLSAWLLALCLPPAIPAWQLLLGAVIAIVFGKQLFGGLGQNPFNPAMLGFAFLLVSFPATVSNWQALAPTPATLAAEVDGLSGATPLDRIHTLAPAGDTERYWQTRQRLTLASTGPWLSLAWLLGGLWLWYRRVIDWRLPVGFIGGLLGAQTLGALGSGLPFGPLSILSVPLSGGIMLGACFILTDPVTAAASQRGRWLYAIGAGGLCWLIREFSSYPEGVAFAVLLMNACVPLIDHVDARMAQR